MTASKVFAPGKGELNCVNTMKNREVFTWVSKSNKFCHRFPKLKIRGVCDCKRMSVYGKLCGKITDRKKKIV